MDSLNKCKSPPSSLTVCIYWSLDIKILSTAFEYLNRDSLRLLENSYSTSDEISVSPGSTEWADILLG